MVRLSDAERTDKVIGTKVTGEYTIGIGSGLDPNFLIIGNINYVENKRAWSGVIFNLHLCAILVVYKVEFCDSSFLRDDG